MRIHKGATETVRITSASRPRSEGRRQRERRYLWSMAVRVLCLVGAVAFDDPWLRGLLLFGAVFLPYFAVVAANEENHRSDGFELRSPDYAAGQLSAGPGAGSVQEAVAR